jgi:diguanylate cyclase (GGDEF)-like protein
MMDLDHFKSVNDLHGHLAGDEVLGAVADAVRGEVRDRDLVGRFGGEEFVVLLPGLDPEQVGPNELYTIAERIRHRIATLTVATDTPDGSLTINGLTASVGGARYPNDGANLEQLMKAADNALFAAKRNGRNAVCIATMASPPTTRTDALPAATPTGPETPAS